MAVTIRDVAALAGVSPSTVSRTCQNSPSISEDTKRRVRQAAKQLGYAMGGDPAQSPAPRTIGVILPPSAREVYENPFYLEMIRGLHKRTYDYLGEMRASTNPLAYCEGGFYGGHLKPSDKIRPLLRPMTASFGITALNELQELYNGKSIAEDGEFALEVLRYINDKINVYKKEDPVSYTHLTLPTT